MGSLLSTTGRRKADSSVEGIIHRIAAPETYFIARKTHLGEKSYGSLFEDRKNNYAFLQIILQLQFGSTRRTMSKRSRRLQEFHNHKAHTDAFVNSCFAVKRTPSMS